MYSMAASDIVAKEFLRSSRESRRYWFVTWQFRDMVLGGHRIQRLCDEVELPLVLFPVRVGNVP